MPTTYPYAAKGAPTVGNGLGGLPRRLETAVATVTAAPTPVGPYYLSTRGQMYNTNQTYCYSPNVTASQSFSDGTYSGNIFYLIKNGTFQYSELTYSESNRQIKTTGGNATTWHVANNSSGYFSYVYCLKHDLSGMVALGPSASVGSSLVNTACYEIVNGVETHYFMTWDSSTQTTVLSKVVPNYATQQVQQAAAVQLSFNYSGATRRPYALFINGDFLYILAGKTNTTTMHLDKFNKSNLTYDSTVYWNIGAQSEPISSGGFYAETATTIAIRYQQASTGAFACVFVLDKTTLKGYDYYSGIGGDSSYQCSLLCDSNEIYLVTGYGSGGSYGATNVNILRSDSVITVASQSYSGATFSLASSVRCTTPKGFNWGSYFANGSGGQNTNLKQIFVPAPGKTFSYSNSGWNFSQSWSASAMTPTSGTAMTLTPATTTDPYTAQFWSFNPLGTTYITL